MTKTLTRREQYVYGVHPSVRGAAHCLGSTTALAVAKECVGKVLEQRPEAIEFVDPSMLGDSVSKKKFYEFKGYAIRNFPFGSTADVFQDADLEGLWKSASESVMSTRIGPIEARDFVAKWALANRTDIIFSLHMSAILATVALGFNAGIYLAASVGQALAPEIPTNRVVMGRLSSLLSNAHIHHVSFLNCYNTVSDKLRAMLSAGDYEDDVISIDDSVKAAFTRPEPRRPAWYRSVWDMVPSGTSGVSSAMSSRRMNSKIFPNRKGIERTYVRSAIMMHDFDCTPYTMVGHIVAGTASHIGLFSTDAAQNIRAKFRGYRSSETVSAKMSVAIVPLIGQALGLMFPSPAKALTKPEAIPGRTEAIGQILGLVARASATRILGIWLGQRALKSAIANGTIEEIASKWLDTVLRSAAEGTIDDLSEPSRYASSLST